MKKENNDKDSTSGNTTTTGETLNVPSDDLKKEAKEFFEIASAYRKERFSHDIKEV